MSGAGVATRRGIVVGAGIAAAAFVGLVAWITWSGLTTERQARARGAAPPAVPQGQLLAVARPVPAPAFDLPTADGGRFALAGARGQVVVVALWATWCAPCVAEMPSLVALGRDVVALRPGRLRVVALSIDEDPAAVAPFFAAPPYAGLPRELVVPLEPGGGPVARAFACAGRGACRPEDLTLPQAFVVDREGRLVAFAVGGLDWSTPGARGYLEALLGP